MVSDKLIVTTGNYASSTPMANETESFDLDASKTCGSTLPAYPKLKKVTGATGAFVSGKLVICGGWLGGTAVSNQCHSIGPNGAAWQPAGNMTKPRANAASVEINEKLLIFGGYEYPNAGEYPLYGYLDSIEELDLEAETSTLVPASMPSPVEMHCAVKINSTTVLIIGGAMGSPVATTNYYNIEDRIFMAGPNLTEIRYAHGCSMMTNSNGSYVVVAGGRQLGDVYDSTVYLDLKEPASWRTGLKIATSIGVQRVG